MMNSNNLKPITYLCDCTLATVATLACKKNPPKAELARQCNIAQFAYDHLEFGGLDVSRMSEVTTKCAGLVKIWAEHLHEEETGQVLLWPKR